MRALSLFSGIGGFDLAAKWAGIEIAGMIENDKFCQKVLKKHWPDVKLLGDVHDAKGDEFGAIDILYGGPPCQPASCAGKRGGKEDSRWLWGETYRIIRATKPKWIILENVRGILSLEGGVVFENLLLELESYGYETRTFCLPACAVNAPHRRDRVWIVANLRCDGCRKGSSSLPGQKSGAAFPCDADRHAPDTGLQGLEKREVFGCDIREERQAPFGDPWQEPWLEAAQRFCVLDARLPDRLVRYSLTMPETNGIMGFILMLRGFHYATSKEARTRKVLPMLQEAFGEESVQWCFGKLSEIFSEEDLRCPVHGKVDGERKENQGGIPKSGIEVSGEELRTMRNGQSGEHPSQGRGLDKQCSCKFDDIVFELSSEIALGEWKRNAQKAEVVLHHLWKESRGERFLHEPLSALYEIWRSVTDYEIGAFKWHYSKRNEHRVQKLKALGNTIVPQIAYIIMKAILESTDGTR